jgi:hypothetical protein
VSTPSGGRPASVRIDDLAAPQFSPDARATLDALDAYGADLVFDPDVLCATATERTGLDTWGSPGFRDRLSVLCEALEATSASPYGHGVTFEQIVGMLSNRLLVEDLIGRHPEILEVPIARPIVIAGLPRTGTTHLHNLLSADPALRHLPYWESLEPVPAVAEQGLDAGSVEAGRRERCAAGLDFLEQAMPLFKRMHEMTVDHAHEEIQLLAVDMAGMLFETTDVLPAWRDAYKATDQTASYAYLRKVLQVITWLRPGKGGIFGTRWVLKSPQHLEQFGPLMATFPDATVVVTHRDPLAVTTSMVTMITYAGRMRSDHPDIPLLARYWADRVADLLEACVRDREVLPAGQSTDVAFDRFMADELGVVEEIYGLADQPFNEAARQGMAAFVESHPRGRHGTIEYDLETLGLDPADLTPRLQPYADRFLT